MELYQRVARLAGHGLLKDARVLINELRKEGHPWAAVALHACIKGNEGGRKYVDCEEVMWVAAKLAAKHKGVEFPWND